MPEPPESWELPALIQGRDVSKPLPTPEHPHPPFFVVSDELPVQPLLSKSPR